MGTITRVYARLSELEELLDDALELPAQRRQEFCRAVTDSDSELQDLLLSLLKSVEVNDDSIKQSVAELAREFAEAPKLVGERIGAYRLEELIGRGGMGDVYRASRVDGAFRRRVAIKVVRSPQVDGAFAAQFRKERQLLASLSHPAIPAIIDAGQLDDGRPYFICEFVEGLPIYEYWEKGDHSESHALSMIEKIGDAVQHAHNNRILHLDIKPDNVLVREDGMPCLLDFGIAQILGDEGVAHRAFTIGYASPEQVRGGRLTAASDVYSLGALLFFLLSGNGPLRDGSGGFTRPSRKEEGRDQCDRSDPGVSKDLNTDLRLIVSKATQEAVAGRYQTVESLLRDIANYRNHAPVSARAPTVGYRLERFWRRNWLALAAAGFAAVVVVLLGFREAGLRSEAEAASLAAAVEAQSARQVSDFLVELFEVADPREATNAVSAEELLDNGASRIAGELGDQPLLQTRLMHTMGRVYMQMGLLRKAESLLKEALSIRDAVPTEEDAELGALLTTLGVVGAKLGNLDESEAALSRGLGIRQRHFGPQHPEVAHSLTFMGVLKTLQYDLDEAEASLVSAISMYESFLGPDAFDLAEPVGNLATVYLRSHRLAESIELSRRSIAIVEAYKGPNSADLAMRLDNLGNTLQEAGRNSEALPLLIRALEIRQATLGATHPLVANNLDNLANVYMATGDYREAESLRLRALSMREELLGPIHPHIATSLGNLGALYTEMARLDEAEDYLQRSMAVRVRVYEPDNPRIAVGRLNLGNVYLQRNEIDKAEQETLDALDIISRELSDDHLYRMYGDWQLAKIYDLSERLADAQQLYERVAPLWESRPIEDPDRVEFLEDYTKFRNDHPLSARN